jgi:hypothetical protein
MFFPNSRYVNAGSYAIERRGVSVLVTRFAVRPRPAVRGFHRRTETQRLDLIAAHYLGDATAGWRLCDASGTLAPDALGARDLVAIPKADR